MLSGKFCQSRSNGLTKFGLRLRLRGHLDSIVELDAAAIYRPLPFAMDCYKHRNRFDPSAIIVAIVAAICQKSSVRQATEV